MIMHQQHLLFISWGLKLEKANNSISAKQAELAGKIKA